MPEFDPDAFLAGDTAVAEFDPDSFLNAPEPAFDPNAFLGISSLQGDSTAATESVVFHELPDHSPGWNKMQMESARRAADAGLPPAPGSRERLTDAIARVEQAGFVTPHFIGSPDEPSGDRAPTRDIENLVESLKLQEARTPEGQREAISKQRAYWEQEVASGMSAEQWRKQTGEADPQYPHELRGRIQPGSLPDRILTWFAGGPEALAKAEQEREAGTGTPLVGHRPMGAMAVAKGVDAVAGVFGNPPVLQDLVETSTTAEPPPPIIPPIGPQEGTAKEITAGIANVPIGFANFLLSPEGVATVQGLGLLPKLAQTLIGLGFTAEQVKGFFEAETLQDKITSGIGAAFLGLTTAAGARRKPASASEAVPATEARPGAEGVPVEAAPLTAEAAGVGRSEIATAPRTPDPTAEMSARSSATRPAQPAESLGPVEPLATERAASTQPEITTPLDATSRATSEVTIPEQVSAKQDVAGDVKSDTAPVAPEILSGSREALVPENLRRSAEVDRLLNEPEAQTGPQMKFEPATEGGALGFGGGKTPKVKAKGTTPRGDTEFLRIDPGWKRAFKGLERKGAADVIGETRNKVGKLLADATKKHVDLEQELFGQLSSELARPLQSLSRKAADKAFDEVAGYLAAKENGRPLPAISPAATKLVNAWENVADQTGKIATANGVQVFDPVAGKHRPMHTMGKTYVPRMFKGEVERVLRDPDSNPKLWNDLVTDFATQRGIPEIDAANQLRGEAGKFSSNDFMGNLEMARTGKMPESFYEYDLREIAARYIPNFSERMAQIIAFGQRLGPREAPLRPNLWDVARKEAADGYTQEWLHGREDNATNFKQKGAAAVGMARAQTMASGLLLSSPTTTVLRNMLSGVSATPELLGVRRSMGALVEIIRNKQARMDAREIGTVRDNIGDTLHADRLGDSRLDNIIRSVVSAGLKWSGYNGSEVFVRSHADIAAAQFAKDAVASLAKNPKSMQSKEALGLFKRTGVSAEKIFAEKADRATGPETRKFIRTFIRDTQGGYRYDQVPAWANSNMGRFFYGFGRWGTQRARNIWTNGIKPAFGEEVQWHGKTMSRVDFRPLAKMLVGSVVLGETYAGIAQVLFGRDRRDASVSEIVEAWKEDEKKAVGMALQRAVNDIIMAGTLGIWSQPVDWSRSLKDQSRLKDPTEPPGLASLRALQDLGLKVIDQGGRVTKKDLLEFARSFAPGAKQVSDVARNVMDEPLYEAENDVKTLRGAAHRWGKDSGLDVSPRARGDFRKSAMAPEYEPIKEALLIGDAQRAKFLAKTFLDKAENRKAALKSLKASVRQSQPFRAGPYSAKEHLNNFRTWAKKNLSEADYQQTERIQARYVKAAGAADLWGKSDDEP